MDIAEIGDNIDQIITPDEHKSPDEINNQQREKRIRKSVSRLSEVYDKTFEQQNENKLKPIVGSGTKLGDIVRFQNASQRNKVNSEFAQQIHTLCYRTKGKSNKRMSEIKKFNGFDTSDEDALKKRIVLAEKMKLDDLRLMCDLFNVPSSGKQKKDIAQAIVEFLRNPFDTGSETFRMNALKLKKPKPKPKSNKSNTIASESSEERDESKKNAVKKEAARKTSDAKTKRTKHEANLLQESSDLSNNVPDSTPSLSDGELMERIAQVLAVSDPNKITLNQVCDRVIEHFPTADLELHRPHIKGLIKQVIDKS